MEVKQNFLNEKFGHWVIREKTFMNISAEWNCGLSKTENKLMSLYVWFALAQLKEAIHRIFLLDEGKTVNAYFNSESAAISLYRIVACYSTSAHA